MKKKWLEDVLIGSVLFLFYLMLGAYMSIWREYLPYDSLARLVSAWLVIHGTEAKLASIGFVWPPLPTLIMIPFTIFPYLVDSWLVAVIPSAGCMALAGVIVGQISRYLKVPDGWRRLFILLFALNPLVVMFAVNGMSEAMLSLCFLLSAYWMIRFLKTDSHTDMILMAGFFSLLPLVRYEFALVTAFSGLILLLKCWERRSQFPDLKTFGEFIEGRLLAYSALAIYPTFLWIIFNWFIMGSPLYFLANDRSALSLADMQLSSYASLIITPLSSLNLVFSVWFGVFLLGLLSFAAAIYLGIRQKSNVLLGVGFLIMVIPFLQFVLLNQRANVPLLRYFVMAIPMGLAVAFMVLDYFIKWANLNTRHRMLIYGGFAILFLVSNLGTYQVVTSYQYQNIEAETWKALTTEEKVNNLSFDEAFMIGKELVKIIPPGSRVLIDTYQFGFGIILGAGNHDLFLDFTDPNYDAALKDPPKYVDYVIVPKASGRGVYYAINRAYKKLHFQGATWAVFEDVLPATNSEWKLYKVIR